MSTVIDSKVALRRVYRNPNPRSVKKEIRLLDRHCLKFVELSPLCVLATSGAGGGDVSPRGGPAGFVKVLDPWTLVLPDFPGNNRLDTLENILENDRVGMLFFVPGMDETLRVNGRALIDTDPELRELGIVDGKLPIAVIRIKVEQAYLHCGKALMRSDFWNSENHIDRTTLPSIGEMIRDQINWDTAETQTEMLVRYKETLY
jgi:PPOX class probable FMN-dependent enzyme